MSIPVWVTAMLVISAPPGQDGGGAVTVRVPEGVEQSATLTATPAAPESEEPEDIVVTARPRANDPVAAINMESFAATQAVDRALVGPIALTYKRTIPDPVRSGIRNFLYNLREPVVFLNFLLQHKPGKAVETLGRFVINSTVGVGGVFDMAKRRPIHLPRRPNGFADTLGFYGVKPGPFFFLPLIGPTTLRDFVGDTVDRLVLPLAVGKPFNKLAFTLPTSALGVVDRRAENDELLHRLHDGPDDPYVATRSFYLKRRQAEIDGLHAKRHAPATDTAPAARQTAP